jgi:hypothetical protein
LTVELATPGFVPALIGDDVRLAAADGTLALRYSDLYVHDADRRRLPATFAVGRRGAAGGLAFTRRR